MTLRRRRYGRRDLFRTSGVSVAALVAANHLHPFGPTAVAAAVAQPADPPPFDLSTGYAPIEVIIPRIIPEVYAFVSPVASDATLVLRITTIVTHAWFDAIAPYHPTAVGISSRIDRRPNGEATIRNKNIAMLYASYHALRSLMPRQIASWDDMLLSVGLDPSDTQEDTATPTGIGNVAGKAVVADRERDGMNQLGDVGGQTYNCRPYANCDGYQPVNSAFELSDPGRWQPDIMSTGNGIFVVQQLVTPQIRSTRPYSYENPDQFAVPPPEMSDPASPGYRQQADELLRASADLTDEQKMMAELFNDKFMGLGFSSLFAATSTGLSLDELVHYDFMTSLASFDTAIAVWNEKVRHDAVRPFSAIRWLYGDELVTAWGGPGKGTVSDLPGREWSSYLNTADHPDYPSGSASFCSAHAEASRRYFGSDAFGWSVPRAAGSSYVEPGITPATDIVLGPWETWTDFEEACGQSRIWSGVHFPAAVQAGHKIGRAIGALAHDFVQAHVAGNV